MRRVLRQALVGLGSSRDDEVLRIAPVHPDMVREGNPPTVESPERLEARDNESPEGRGPPVECKDMQQPRNAVSHGILAIKFHFYEGSDLIDKLT